MVGAAVAEAGAGEPGVRSTGACCAAWICPPVAGDSVWDAAWLPTWLPARLPRAPVSLPVPLTALGARLPARLPDALVALPAWLLGLSLTNIRLSAFKLRQSPLAHLIFQRMPMLVSTWLITTPSISLNFAVIRLCVRTEHPSQDSDSATPDRCASLVVSSVCASEC